MFNDVKMACICFSLPKAPDWLIARQERDRQGWQAERISRGRNLGMRKRQREGGREGGRKKKKEENEGERWTTLGTEHRQSPATFKK